MKPTDLNFIYLIELILKILKKMLFSYILAYYTHGKASKMFKISASKWSDELSLNYVMDHILLKAFKITLCISLKNMKL